MHHLSSQGQISRSRWNGGTVLEEEVREHGTLGHSYAFHPPPPGGTAWLLLHAEGMRGRHGAHVGADCAGAALAQGWPLEVR